MRLRKFVLLTVLILVLSTGSAFAVCKGRPLNPLTDVRWNCMLPFIVGPVPIGSSGHALADYADHTTTLRAPICYCVKPPPVYVQIGIPVAYRETIRVIETTKDPWCFPVAGFGLTASYWDLNGKDGKEVDKKMSNHVHVWNFIPTALMRIAQDVSCGQFDPSEMSMSSVFMSEPDLTKKSSHAALMMAPETLLFNNPIAQLACELPDSVAGIGEFTIPPLYWCAGGHGMYPQSLHTTKGTSYVDTSSTNAAKAVFFLHKTFQLWGTIGAQGACDYYPMPIWNKMQYRFQHALPIPDWSCRRMGQVPLLWNHGKNTPGTPNNDNLAILLWRKRNCCAF